MKLNIVAIKVGNQVLKPNNACIEIDFMNEKMPIFFDSDFNDNGIFSNKVQSLIVVAASEEGANNLYYVFPNLVTLAFNQNAKLLIFQPLFFPDMEKDDFYFTCSKDIDLNEIWEYAKSDRRRKEVIKATGIINLTSSPPFASLKDGDS